MQSPAGQKYVLNFTDEVTSPFSAIINAVKIGIVMLFSGPGLVAAAQRYDLWFLYAMGMLLTLAGVGFLISAVISYFLLKKIRSAETKSATKD